MRTPGWSSGILMFTGTLFFISLAIYLGIIFGYNPYLTSRLKTAENNITKFTQKTPVDQQEKIIRFFSQISNLRNLLSDQQFASGVFPWLQDHTQANISYSGFNASLVKSQVNLSGEARTVRDLAEQIAVFENLPEIRDVTFSGTSQNPAGFWTFSFVLSFDPKFLERQEIPVTTTP